MTEIGRWIRDWRTIATLTAAVLVGLLAVLVITSISDRENALQVAKRVAANEQAERVALNHRIDQLLGQIGTLEGDARGNAQQLAVLRREVELLQQQIRDMGGQPVVVVGAGGSSTAHQSASPSPTGSSRPSPTHTATPYPTPAPSPTRTCIAVICIR